MPVIHFGDNYDTIIINYRISEIPIHQFELDEGHLMKDGVMHIKILLTAKL